VLLLPPRPTTEIQGGKSENCLAILESSKTRRKQRQTLFSETEENDEKSQVMIIGTSLSTEWNQTLSEYYSEGLRLEKIAPFFFISSAESDPLTL
jgi:hypothetical protein